MDNLTIVIPYYEEYASVMKLLDSIPSDIPIILVDDQSAVPMANPGLSNLTVYRPEDKLYFTGAVNYGIDRCNTDVLVLNQDVVLEGTAWQQMLDSKRGEYALIGECIKGNHPAFPHGYVHGVFQFMRRDAIDKVGLMDEELYPLWGASALWQLSICRAGFKSLPLNTIQGLWHEPRAPGAHFGKSIVKLLELEPDKRNLLIQTPPLVSVIIPCYNHGRYLEEAIASLVGGYAAGHEWEGQSFQSFEVIIVDDGSNQYTASEAIRLADAWKGVRYIRKRNGGTASASNLGISIAVGRYMTIMGADDMRESWSLGDLYKAAVRHPDEFVYDAPIIYANGVRRHTMHLSPYDCKLLPKRNMVPAGIFFPKVAWQQVNGYPENMVYGREDWAFNIALALSGWYGHQIERSGYLYRREGQNRSIHNGEYREKFMSQLVQTFPEAYRGEGMCCGKGRNNLSTRSSGVRTMAKFDPASIPQEGMVLLQYQGRNMGTETWGGPGTVPSGRYYTFGGGERDKVKFVDKRDVDWFLNYREQGAILFVMAKTTEQSAKPESVKMDKDVGREEDDKSEKVHTFQPVAHPAELPKEGKYKRQKSTND